jgi:hypothetical protein
LVSVPDLGYCKRLHSTLGYVSPVDIEQQMNATQSTVRLKRVSSGLDPLIFPLSAAGTSECQKLKSGTKGSGNLLSMRFADGQVLNGIRVP